MKWFSKSAQLFSGKTCLAAFLALYIALKLNLDKPAWSLTTVYVTSQLYSASTISKSLGMILGGLFVLLIYPATVQDPMLFSLCISMWVALCLYLSLHDRTPKSYVFMLAGYSAAIMGFPDVTAPASITYTVISRIEDISVAILCSSLVHRLIMPVSMSSMLEQSVNFWYQNARKLYTELITVMPKEKSLEQEDILIQMANYPLNVETLITHCVYEGEAARRLIRLVSVQYQHLSYLIPTLTAIEARLTLLAEQQIPFPEQVAQAFQQFLQWLNSTEHGAETLVIKERLNTAQQHLKADWESGRLNIEASLLLTGLLERLLNFVRIAEAYQTVGDRVSDLTPSARPGKVARSHEHVDKGMLLLSCLTAFLATFVSFLFWIGSGWVDGSTAPMMVAVLCSLFSVPSLLQFITAVELNSASLVMRQQFVTRTLDKVNVILPRKRIDSDSELAAGGNLITEDWLGANCFDFYARHQSLLAEQGISSDRFFGELRIFLKNHIRVLQSQPHEVLLEELNQLILSLEALTRHHVGFYMPLFHLFNVRLSLFPLARWPETPLIKA